MSVSRSMSRTLVGTLAVVFVGGILASSALGSLSIHLRVRTSLPEDPPTFTNGVAVEAGVTTYVPMEIWAVVTDYDGELRDEGVWKFYSAFYSSDGGLIKGNLMAAFVPAGAEHQWGQGNTADEGLPTDLDGDGDNDVGSHFAGDPSPPWFQARHSSGDTYHYDDYPVPEVHPLYPIPPFDHPSPAEVEAWKEEHATNEFHVANLYFFPETVWNETAGGYDGRPGVTEIWAAPRQFGVAQWMEDDPANPGENITKVNFVNPAPGDPNAGELLGGDKVVLYVVSEAVPPPGFEGGFRVGPADPPLVLNGRASTGSINWWGWDFDGDGIYDIEGLGEHGFDEITVTYQDLIDLGLEEGIYPDASMAVAWVTSPATNEDDVTFEFEIFPEPATIALLVAGCLLTRIRRRR